MTDSRHASHVLSLQQRATNIRRHALLMGQVQGRDISVRRWVQPICLLSAISTP